MRTDDVQVLDKIDLVSTRSYVPADRNFILSTWLRGLYYGNTFFSDIPKDIFMRNYHAILEKLLDNPTVETTVSCLKDDPEVVLGYSVAQTAGGITALHYVFVKSAWRKIGIAKSIVPSNVNFVTHMTKLGKLLRPQSWSYNPFLVA